MGLPYAAWTVIYYIYTLATPTSTFPYYSLRVGEIFSASGAHYFVHLLTTGYYHLYYLLVIMEFYVLFPLLLLFVRRFAKWHVHLMLAAVLWQVLYGVLVSSHYFGFHLSGFMQTRLIFSYPVYLVGGVITALHLDDFHAWACRYARLIVALTFTSALLGELFVYLARYTGVPVFLRTGSYVFSPMIVPYNVGAILCVYLLGVFLVSPSRSWRTRSAVSSGSDNSYGVYLSQMLWIPLLVRVRAHLGVQIPWEVAAPLALVTVYSMGYVFTGLFARTPLAKAVSGRGQASWGSLLVWRHKPQRRDDTGEGPLNVALE